MRYLFVLLVAVLVVACTVPPMDQKPKIKPAEKAVDPAVAPTAWPVLPVVEVTAPKEHKEGKPARAGGKNPCVDIDADDIKDSINLKLECIERELR